MSEFKMGNSSDDFFGMKVAQVVCRQLGMPQVLTALFDVTRMS